MRLADGVEGELERLDEGLRTGLEVAEFLCGHEFVITSMGREGEDGCHGEWNAVDIRCGDSRHRFRFVKGLLDAGFERIGVYTRHIHADVCMEGDFEVEVLWLGGASK